jgi:hypothetical protein
MRSSLISVVCKTARTRSKSVDLELTLYTPGGSRHMPVLGKRGHPGQAAKLRLTIMHKPNQPLQISSSDT